MSSIIMSVSSHLRQHFSDSSTSYVTLRVTRCYRKYAINPSHNPSTARHPSPDANVHVIGFSAPHQQHSLSVEIVLSESFCLVLT